jgi:DNA-binding transcriptional regulator YdaS (Cro superfamily)
LHKACEVAGGIPALAAQLQVSARALERWLKGDEQPPTEIFLACVDIALSPVAQRRDEGKR